ncbi:bifunctional DNA primase/polymerase-like protein [Pseudonocardia kunmingensis]|uniref:Bifunctional DNA primase/polymerase-like protein n=2 Tax=Pseudonocardia kunmingensis TaxID=630975 RepID=A0A543DKE9_9PSEU|nr:bifunctional DNA primase/polymerase-like protein [Pseudonocardia kunmingensis]
MAHHSLMRAALYLAARGMRVFPLNPGTKVPGVRRDWEGCATTDAEQIERWWASSPQNIGIATGPSRLLVVDLDAPKMSSAQRIPHGRQVLAGIAREAGEVIPRDTLTVATAGGGQHLYFRVPPDLSLTNTVGRLGRHIDTRARGGYVVGPGSIVRGRRYRMVCAAEPATVPAWIVRALRPTMPRLPAPTAKAHPAYVRAALDGEARRVADAPVGQRNVTLYQAAARLGRFVREGRLRADDVRSVLGGAAARHLGVEGFGTHEAHRAIESGLRRSFTAPARLPSSSDLLRRRDHN